MKGISTYLLPAFLLFCMHANGQVLLNELSPDSGNSDASNDAIVELINSGAAPVDIGCYVVSNSEWVVVIPPNTMLAAGEVFLIACSDANQAATGINPNPTLHTGLTCVDCDFPNMPIDLDVCDPANAEYIDWAASGFTLDNSGASDGDQVVLFSNSDADADGKAEVLDAVIWGGGSTHVSDNTQVSSGMDYTLGVQPAGVGFYTAALLPIALQDGESCDLGFEYTMPGYTGPLDTDYADLTAYLNSCNSSYIRMVGNSATGDGSESDWTVTNHPNPGFANDTPFDNFTVTGDLIQCAGVGSPITFTYEVFNYQNVEKTITNTTGTSGRTTYGSFVLVDGLEQAWDNISADGNGTTTLTYTFTPTAEHSLRFVWDDATILPFNANCCGTSSQNVATNGSNECYEANTQQIKLLEPLTGTGTVACVAATGAMTISGISGEELTFALWYDNETPADRSDDVLVSSSSMPMLTLSNGTQGQTDANNFYIVVSNPCAEQVLTTGLCMGDPPCPEPVLHEMVVPMMACVGDEITISIDEDASQNLPDGGVIEWYWSTDMNFNPFEEGTKMDSVSKITSINQSTILLEENFNTLVISSSNNTWIDNSTLSNWYASEGEIDGNRGSSNTGALYSYGLDNEAERALGSRASNGTGTIFWGVEILNTTGQEITKLDITHDIEQWRVDNVTSCPESLNFAYQIDINASTVTGIQNGTWVNYASGSFDALTCQTTGTIGAQNPPLISNKSFSITSISIPANGSIWLRWEDTNAGGNDNGFGIDNFVARVAKQETTVTDAKIPIPKDWCNAGPVYIKGIVAPSATSGSCAEADQTVTAGSIDINCPVVTLSGMGMICEPSTGTVTLAIEHADANTDYTIDISRDMTTSVGDTTITTDANGDGTGSINVSETGTYDILSVSGGSCAAMFMGSADFEFFEQPNAALSGTVQACPGSTIELAATILAGTGPFDITYDLLGGVTATDQMATVGADGRFSIILPADVSANITITLTAITDAMGCSGTASGMATIEVLPLPPVPIAANQESCAETAGNTSITFSISNFSTGQTLNWYAQELGGTPVGLGNNLTQMVLPAGTFPEVFTLWAELESEDGCIQPARTPVTVTLTEFCCAISCDDIVFPWQN